MTAAGRIYSASSCSRALKIIDRGDLTPAQMRGPWAGETWPAPVPADPLFRLRRRFRRRRPCRHAEELAGRACFGGELPGEARLAARSAVASGSQGSRRSFPWEHGRSRVKLPRSEWVAWGSRAAQREPSVGRPAASLLLPMGRNGPAFLAYQNFDVLSRMELVPGLLDDRRLFRDAPGRRAARQGGSGTDQHLSARPRSSSCRPRSRNGAMTSARSTALSAR